MDVKMAFCGASGTGKTTMARILRDGMNLPMNPVGSRSVANVMGFSSPYDVDIACRPTYSTLRESLTPDGAAEGAIAAYTGGTNMRRPFQEMLRRGKVSWEREMAGFVTDRTPMDDLTYALMHDVHSIDEPLMYAASQHTKSYDLVFFAPLGMFDDGEADPARMPSNVYHIAFEAMLRGMLLRHNVSVHALDMESVQDRKDFIYKKVQDLLVGR